MRRGDCQFERMCKRMQLFRLFWKAAGLPHIERKAAPRASLSDFRSALIAELRGRLQIVLAIRALTTNL